MRDWRVEIERRLRGADLSSGSEADVIEELEQHLEDRYRELRQGGVEESEAVRVALEELQGQEPLRLALRNVKQRPDSTVALGEQRRRGVSGVWQDVRYALRMFRKNAGFTAAAMLALGLGAGAATAVFSLLEGVVLRPLPYARPDRLVMLFETNEQKSLDHEPFSPVTMMEYRRLEGAFQDVAGWWRPEVNLVDNAGDPIRVSTVEASENLFAVLGVNVALGRTFPQDATLHGQEPEVLISDRLWRTRFGADPSVAGRSIRMNGQALIVVGVMPPGFHFPDDTDAWQRLSWDLEQHNRAARFMGVVGRLRPAVSVEQANAEMNGLARRLETEYPRSNQGWKARAIPLRADVAGVFGPGLLALFGAAGLLLLIACINVANLLLARSSARQTEVALRSALGASRLRLLRQFLLESLVLSAGGALVGLLVAVTAVRGFLRWTPIEIPRADEVSVNFAVLGFTALTTIVTAIIFGLAPALLASRVNLQVALKESTRAATGRAGRMARSVLVVAEVALAVALLAGAGLLIRTINALMHENTGVQPGTAISVDLQLPYNGYPDWPAVERFYSTLLPALRARSPISSVGASNFMPLETGWRMPYRLPGSAPARANEQTLAQYHTVDEGYFQTLGVRLLRGRFFAARDAAGAPGVVVVNESFARLLWPGENPVGNQIHAVRGNVGPLGGSLSENDLHEVIGVVADVKNTSIKMAAEPAIY
ncbi:MAG: ADOP family duplicated permease, partial [Longimicrobiales bacterium]